MVRLATHTDVYRIATQLYQLKEKSTWAQWQHEGWNIPDLVDFVLNKMGDPYSALFVTDHAFCGGSLGRMVLPPYFPYVAEWGWDGPKREAVECLNALFEWGKQHGAELGGYTLNQVGKSSKKVSDTVVWRKL